MKDFVHWLNLSIKTIVSVIIAFVPASFVSSLIERINADSLFFWWLSLVAGIVVFCVIGWLICPHEVKSGIKNW